jgi:uncharacterized Zn-binding protein involved in type VI secretion
MNNTLVYNYAGSALIYKRRKPMATYDEIYREALRNRWKCSQRIKDLYEKELNRHMRTYEAWVCDNKDPEGLGRLRILFPLWSDGDDAAITDWVPVGHRHGGEWSLPEINTKVAVSFLHDDVQRPIVMGAMMTRETPCPTGNNKGNDIKYIRGQSGHTQITIDDTPGKEKITAGMFDGKIRMVLDANGGVELANEIGDIEIECKKFTIQAEEEIVFDADKTITIESEGDITFESEKNIMIKAGSDIKIKAKEIKIEANGCTAGMKPIAAKDDKVIGVDFHIEMVPAGTSQVPVPIPNPFQGKLADKLSKDVKFKGKAVAVKGSKAKNEPHKIMPPGTSFQKGQPKDEGEITMGTIPTVKVNGKEIAVLGAKVTTCDDLGTPFNGTVISSGSGQQPAIQIPVTKPIDRSLSNPKWSKTEAKVGEEIGLSVQLKKQYEGAGVTFKIYPEGADTTKKHLAIAYGKNEGGKANAQWRYDFDYEIPFPENPMDDYLRDRLGIEPDPRTTKHYIKNYEEKYDNPFTKKAKFIFTAESFGCGDPVESGAVEVGDDLEIKFLDEYGKPKKDVEYSILCPDGSKIEGKTGQDGTVLKKATILGCYQIQQKPVEEKNG